MDGFPADQARDMRDVQRGLETAQRSAATGRPLTEASKGWILRAMDSPDPEQLEPGDVWIFASGGRLHAMEYTGSEEVLEVPDFPQGTGVSNPAFPLTNATPSYNQAQIQTIVDTVDNLNTALVALLNSLRGADLIA